MPNLESLRALMRLQSPANLSSTGDPYLNKRRQQMALGEDELAPSELDQLTTQQQLGAQGYGVSRDMIRDAGIQGLKQKLGLIQAEAQSKLQPEIIKGEYGVKAAREAAHAAESRRQASANDIAARQEANLKAMEDRFARTQEGLNTRQQTAIAAGAYGGNQRPQSPTDAMEKRLSEARSGYGGTFSRLGRMIGLEGGRGDYANALTSVLTRMGVLDDLQGDLETLKKTPGATLEERIRNAGADPATLHPYEREWLQLQLEQTK